MYSYEAWLGILFQLFNLLKKGKGIQDSFETLC